MKHLMFAACFCSWLIFLATTRCFAQNPPPVFLDQWLVVEGCAVPSLKGILLNDTQIQIFSPKQQAYLTAEYGGGSVISANRTSASLWETFRLLRLNETAYNIKVQDGRYIGLPQDGNELVSVATTPRMTETFMILKDNSDPFRVRFLATNGKYWQAVTGDLVTADYGGHTTDWSDGNPSVFQISTVGTLKCITSCGYFV